MAKAFKRATNQAKISNILSAKEDALSFAQLLYDIYSEAALSDKIKLGQINADQTKST